MTAPVRTLDALKPFVMGRVYRVATFREDRDGRAPRVAAYSRDYNAEWPGCVLYDVMADSARVARSAAKQHRKEHP